jgi:hypothetical protein
MLYVNMATIISYDTDLLPPPQLVFPTLDDAMAPNVPPGTPAGNDPYLDWPYVPVPKGLSNVGNLDLNNLATPENVKKLQDQMNKLAEKKYKDSTWRGLTLRLAVTDMSEAITGILSDIYKNKGKVSVKELFTKDNRMRGLGLLFVLISVVSILLVTLG